MLPAAGGRADMKRSLLGFPYRDTFDEKALGLGHFEDNPLADSAHKSAGRAG